MSTDKYFDPVCGKSFSTQSALNKHLASPSHMKKLKLKEYEKYEDEEEENTPEEYNIGKNKFIELNLKKNLYCPLCDYQNPRQTNFVKHTNSKLHNQKIDTYEENGGNKQLRKDLTNLDVFIGLFKGKQITKEDVKKEYETDKYMKEATEEESNEKERKKLLQNIKDKEKEIENQEKYIKELEDKAEIIEKDQPQRSKQFKKERLAGAIKALNKYKTELKQLKKQD
jgi:hypothetical protein